MVAKCLALAALVLLAPASALGAPQFQDTPAPEILPTQNSDNLGFFDAELLPSGETVAAWYDFGADEVRTARREPGGGWVRERTLYTASGAPFSAGNGVQVAADAEGNAIAVWAANNHLWHADRPAGGTWGTPVEHNGVDLGSDPELAVAPDGRVLVAYVSTDFRVRSVWRPAGASEFVDAQDLLSADNGEERGEVSAVFTSAGRAVVVWTNYIENDIDAAKREPTNPTFETEVTAYGVSPAGRNPKIAADGQGNTHLVFWTRDDPGNAVGVWGKLLPAGSITWSTSEPISSQTGTTTVGSTAVVGDPDGQAIMIGALENGTLFTATRPPAGPYLPPATITTGVEENNGLALHRDTTGAFTALYTSVAQPRTRIITRPPDGSFGAPQVADGQGESDDLNLTSDPTGNVLATWVTLRDGVPDVLSAAPGDSGAPPALSLSAPASLLAGQPGAFGLTATDFTGISSSTIAFGDGAAVNGTSASHVYGAAGAFTASGTAVDGRGNAASTTAGVGVTTPPAPAGATPPAGSPRGPSGARRRTTQPDANIDRIARTVRRSRLRQFSGRATDQLGLRGVEIALVRLRGGARFNATAAARRCDALRSNGRVRRTRVRRGRCAPQTFLKARGTSRWTFRLKRRLPRGSYVLVARARAADGTVERGFSASDRNLVRFRVR